MMKTDGSTETDPLLPKTNQYGDTLIDESLFERKSPDTRYGIGDKSDLY
jgi:hypothetical protein